MDVTSSKRRHTVLRESEDRYRKLVEMSPDAIIVHCEGGIIFANPASARLLGVADASRLIGKAIHDVVHPDYRAIVDARARQAMRDGAAMLPIIEERLLKLDGTPVDVEVVAMPVTFDGKPAVQVMLRNITAHRAAVDALRDSERRYRELADSLPLPVFESDENGLIVFANQSALATFGYTEEDLRPCQSLFKMLQPDQLQRAKEDMPKCLAGEPQVKEYEFLRKDGSSFVGVAYAKAIMRSGRVVGFREVIVDISERKRAEHEVQGWRFEWEALFQSVGDPAIILDAEYRILAINHSTSATLHAAQEHLKGRHCYEIFHRMDVPPQACPMKAVLASRVQETAEVEMEELGATCLIRCTPVVGTDGQIERFVHIATDITALKKGEEQLKASAERLQATLEATVRAMALTVETRDPYTASHQRRVAALATSLAREMCLPEEQTRLIQLAAIVHDIGKIGVPAEILSKPGQLSQAELRIMKDHPQVGHDLLSTIAFPWPIAEVVRQHHERLDGSGYPSGLSDTDILLEARVIAVADVVEAMASHRPYRPAKRLDEALAEISIHRGTLYDAQVADACARVLANGSGFGASAMFEDGDFRVPLVVNR